MDIGYGYFYSVSLHSRVVGLNCAGPGLELDSSPIFGGLGLGFEIGIQYGVKNKTAQSKLGTGRISTPRTGEWTGPMRALAARQCAAPQ